ncbi:MAG TPA: hypothetical protein VMI31_00915 [Fimbriimonadaceae bacterium]|nr:hypothetical protein [Fimbriimonadaceae bacterium]
MPTDPHLEPEDDALAKMGYEVEDVQFKSLGKSVIWFFAFVFFCGISGYLIFGYYIGFDKLKNPPADTTPFASRIPPSPNPLLQTNETAKSDIRDLRQKENAILYGKPAWVDKSKGIVRIPIDQAIDLYLSKIAPTASKQATMSNGMPPVGGSSDDTGGGAPQ